MNRLAAMTAKTQEVLAEAKRLYGVDINPSIRYDLRGRTAGWARCQYCYSRGLLFSLRFNVQLINGDHFEDMLNETVPHEVAHLVCFARADLGRKHDDGWRRVCLALGGNGKTRHSYDVDHADGSYLYRATCGTEIKLSHIMHRKIQLGQVRLIRKTRGRITRDCAWAPPGGQLTPTKQVSSIMPVPPITPVVPARPPQRDPLPAPAQPQVFSKAHRVRGLILQAIGIGLDQEWVVQQAITTLGMPRGQALRYTAENWIRVAEQRAA